MVENLLNSVLTTSVFWVYVVTAAAIFVQSMGIPFAGDIATLMAAAFAAEGLANPVLVIVAVTVGSSAGSALGYWFGSRLLRPFLLRFPRLNLDAPVTRRGLILLFAARFSGPTRFLTGLVPGAMRMPVRPFAVITVTGSVAWACAAVVAMVLVGKGVVHDVHLWVLTAGCVALVVAAVGLAFSTSRRQTAQ